MTKILHYHGPVALIPDQHFDAQSFFEEHDLCPDDLLDTGECLHINGQKWTVLYPNCEIPSRDDDGPNGCWDPESFDIEDEKRWFEEEFAELLEQLPDYTVSWVFLNWWE